MRSTTDLQTGKQFRWNGTVFVRVPGGSAKGLHVPSRDTRSNATNLHPLRVRHALLQELNAGLELEQILALLARFRADEPELAAIEPKRRGRPSGLAGRLLLRRLA